MKDNEYSLQFLHSEKCLSTREKARDYINERFKNKALIAEPAIVFYGEEANPNAMIAIGSADEQVFIIDTAKMNEDIANVIEEADNNSSVVDTLSEALSNVVKACGLVWDTNKIVDQISYVPDVKDEIIGNAENISEAVQILSTYVKEELKKCQISFADSKSISIISTENADGSRSIKAAVKFSSDGDSDENTFNDNIVGLKSDGIFAAANLEYDEDSHRLIFTTSGMRNGRFVDDAKKQIVELGEHKQYDASNIGHTVKITTNKEENLISADVKISEDENNILNVQDGSLIVDGRANNIKYKGKTVFKGISDLENSVNDIQEEIVKINDTHFIEGVNTDTLTVIAERNALGFHKISGNVRLSDNKSIKVVEGGLAADVNLEFDAVNNKLVFTIGETSKELKLNGVDLVDSIYYDSINKKIVIVTKAGTLEVNVDDLFKTWEVENLSDSPIVLNKITNADPKVADKLRANLNLASTNNLLEVENGKLIAKESKISDAVAVEQSRATDAEKALGIRIQQHEDALGVAISDINTKIQTNSDNITAEQNRAEMAENDLNHSVETLNTSVNDLNSKVSSIESDVDGIAVRVQSAESQIEVNSNDITTNRDNIASNTEKINAINIDLTQAKDSINEHIATVDIEISNLKAKDEEHSTGISENATNILAESNRAKEAENALVNKTDNIDGRLASAEEQITTINGSEATANSIRYIVKHSFDDMKTYVDNGITNATSEITATASSDATEKANNALADAKAYTDVEKERAMTAENSISEEINGLKQKDIELAAGLALKIEEITIEKDSVSDLQYILYADGKKAGEINIPKDNFLKSADYNAASKELIFVFSTADGDNISKIDVSDLVDIYEAGNGLSLNDNVFSVKVSPASESYLIVDENGIRITGIDSALIEKANVDDVYTKAVADAKFITEHQDLSHLATKEEVSSIDSDLSGLEGRVAANESKLTVINGNEAEEGSIKKSLADAKAYTDEKLADVYTKAESDDKYITEHQDISLLATKEEVEEVDGKVNANKADIDILKGNESQEGSVANAIKVSKEYTDSQLVSKIEEVKVVKNPASDLQYILMVDGNESGFIDIPKDQFLKDAKYDSRVKELTFIFDTSEGEKITTINIADLIDTYTAGDGLAETDNKFEIKIDTASEDYISVSAEGIKIQGINAKLDAKANVGDSYTKHEIDDFHFLTEHQSIDNLATVASVEAAQAKADANESAIAILNGNEAQEGSVKKSLEDAKAYTDSKVADKANASDVYTKSEIDNKGYLVSSDIENFVERSVFNEKVNELQEKDSLMQSEIDSKIESVEIVKNSASDLQYILKVDGVNVSEINIPKDQFLKEVSYDSGNKQINFTFETSAGTSTTSVDVSDLVDIYEAGNGLSLNDNVFSVKVNEDSEAYLKLTSEGLSIFGINDALSNKANVADVYLKSEIDSLNGNLSNRIDDAVSEIASVSSTVADHSESIAKLDGNEAVAGSVSNAIKVSKEYTDAQINTVNSALSDKANVGDSYTKTEIDNMGFLTEHQDISLLATKTELANVDAKADSAIEKNSEQDTKIFAAEAELIRQNLKVEDTNTVDMTVSKADDGTTLSANVKVKSSGVNIIKSDSEGIFANVTLGYNAATNTIIFNNGNGEVDLVLSEHTLVEDGYYESATQKIVLIVKGSDEISKRIEIPVGDLVNTFEVANSDDNPIKLYKTAVGGIDTLSAGVAISSETHNAIVKNNGTLYVSNRAADLTANYGIDGEVSIQVAIEKLKAETDKIEGLKDDVDDAVAKVDALDTKVNTFDNRIASNSTAITTLNSQVTTLTSDLTNVKTEFQTLKSEVSSNGELVSSCETRIATLETKVDALTNNMTDVLARLTAIETALDNLIDFGSYTE